VGGVRWINDSKATNVASTVVAIEAMDRPFVLLLGGRHKGEPYTRLGPLLKPRCQLVIAFGEAGPIVERDLRGAVQVERGGDFADVMARARRAARSGEAVLLSPACSSYDMFTNYEERGATFRRLALAA
jgi:UDP-N-acetylmuramoylalanine--D-glutamate ligase